MIVCVEIPCRETELLVYEDLEPPLFLSRDDGGKVSEDGREFRPWFNKALFGDE